ITAVREDRPERAAAVPRLLLGALLQVVQPSDKHKVRDLLDDLERVRDAAGPERVPDLVDPAPELARDHVHPSVASRCPFAPAGNIDPATPGRGRSASPGQN